jgi:hypothetical protein
VKNTSKLRCQRPTTATGSYRTLPPLLLIAVIINILSQIVVFTYDNVLSLNEKTIYLLVIGKRVLVEESKLFFILNSRHEVV